LQTGGQTGHEPLSGSLPGSPQLPKIGWPWQSKQVCAQQCSVGGAALQLASSSPWQVHDGAGHCVNQQPGVSLSLASVHELKPGAH